MTTKTDKATDAPVDPEPQFGPCGMSWTVLWHRLGLDDSEPLVKVALEHLDSCHACRVEMVTRANNLLANLLEARSKMDIKTKEVING